MKEEKILKRDEKLLKNEKSWRRARTGAIILAVIQIIFLAAFIKNSSVLQGEKEAIASLVASALFWLLIIDWLNLRLNHIDSIKLYRNKLNH
jgi:hypothetical protein